MHASLNSSTSNARLNEIISFSIIKIRIVPNDDDDDDGVWLRWMFFFWQLFWVMVLEPETLKLTYTQSSSIGCQPHHRTCVPQLCLKFG